MESGGDGRYSLAANEVLPDLAHASPPTEDQSSLVQSYGSANVPLIGGERESGAQVHRYRSYAQAESTASNDTIDNVKRAHPVVGGSHAEILRSENLSINVPSNLGLSESLQDQSTTLSLQDSSAVLPGASVVDGQTNTSAAYQLVLPLLTALFASYIASSTGVYISLSPCLQLLIPLALPYLLPRPTSATTSFFNLVTMVFVALATSPLIDNLDSIRQAATQWIGNDPIVAVVKLTLCAVITAQLPKLIESFDNIAHMGLAVMAFLSRFDGTGCQGGLLNTYTSSEESCSASRSREGSSMSSWLAAMRELSLVAVV
jgi:hypothetical protein